MSSSASLDSSYWLSDSRGREGDPEVALPSSDEVFNRLEPPEERQNGSVCKDPSRLNYLICSIHGLSGRHPFFTNSLCFTQTPSIFRFNYDPYKIVGEVDPGPSMREVATDLLVYINKVTESDKTKPDTAIAFMASDIGGSILKQALVMAISDPPQYKDLLRRITLLVFFGTPHRQTPNLPWTSILLSIIASFVQLDFGTWFPSFIQRFSEYHQSLFELFRQQRSKYSVISYFRSRETPPVPHPKIIIHSSKQCGVTALLVHNILSTAATFPILLNGYSTTVNCGNGF
ncbi:hypothetical protein B0T17DRAFT_234179 [Bombardia bombarda]|uniref:DUF676 domain-containing protein n=1 Tax=Bombardia bombarda TaxID=252184 RepID=A0AA39XCU9_9PEZI|nr:hypothetical protein B0T17DRAFT_234179 [Bombardia bombarda]